MPLQEDLLKLYPNDAALGSPFEAELVGASSNDRFYGSDNQYKREAALLTDGIFNAPRRMQLEASVKRRGARCWSYLFSQPTPMTMLALKAVSRRNAVILLSRGLTYSPAAWYRSWLGACVRLRFTTKVYISAYPSSCHG